MCFFTVKIFFLPRATLVPVGEDQISHLNLASFLARAFNKRFGDTFPVPQAFINGKCSGIILFLLFCVLV